MPDIAMCYGETQPSGRRVCEKRDACHRYTATPSRPRQTYLSVLAIVDGNCPHYWPTKEPPK